MTLAAIRKVRPVTNPLWAGGHHHGLCDGDDHRVRHRMLKRPMVMKIPPPRRDTVALWANLALLSLAFAGLLLLLGCVVDDASPPSDPHSVASVTSACAEFSERSNTTDMQTVCLPARVIAVGLQSVYGVRQVGMFHADTSFFGSRLPQLGGTATEPQRQRDRNGGPADRESMERHKCTSSREHRRFARSTANQTQKRR